MTTKATPGPARKAPRRAQKTPEPAQAAPAPAQQGVERAGVPPAPVKPAPDPAQETRELLVWGAIPAAVGGIGLIVDGVYMLATSSSRGLDFGLSGAYMGSRSQFDLVSSFSTITPVSMIAIGAVVTILLALSRLPNRRAAIVGGVGLIVFAVLVLAYLIYTLVTGSAGIYSLVLTLLIVCVAIAGGSGLMARRVFKIA